MREFWGKEKKWKKEPSVRNWRNNLYMSGTHLETFENAPATRVWRV